MRHILILLFFILLPATALRADETSVEACARLAAHPDENAGIIGGDFEGLATGEALSICRKAHADAPDSVATTYRLGRVLLARKSHAESTQLFFEAARAGYPMAQLAYGQALREARGVAWDPVASSAWIARAADQGHAAAQMALANNYLDGYGVPQDTSRAEALYQAAATGGIAASYRGLGNIYAYAMFGRLDQRAIHFYEEALAANVPEAGADIARVKLCDCPERDLDGAISLLEAAGEQGVVRAWSQLGLIYRDNHYGRRDHLRAFSLFKRAAELGDINGAFQLGIIMKDESERRPEYRAESEKWLRVAARAGLPDAQMALGEALLFAPDDRRQEEDGVRWLEYAAAAGKLDAFISLYNYFMLPEINDLDRVYDYGQYASQFPTPEIANWGVFMMEQVMERKRLEGLEGLEPPAPAANEGRG